MDQKPRSDAKLLNLPEEQQAQLADWLLGGMPYHEARTRVEETFGVAVKSLSAFSQFYFVVCRPHLLRKRAQAATMAEEVAEEARKSPAQFDAATIDAIKQRAFELAISPHSSPKDVKAIFMLLQKSRDQEIKAGQLALARDRYEVDCCTKFLEWLKDAKAREIAESGLSNSEKIAALRKAYFSDVDALQASGTVQLPPA